MSQYFENDEKVEHADLLYSFTLLGKGFTFHSDNGVFSKDGLDDGSRLLLETIAKTDLGQNILDLGCGIGPLGIVLASFDPTRHLTMADVSDRALDAANRQSCRGTRHHPQKRYI